MLAILAAGLITGASVQAGEAGISAKEFVERYNTAVEKYNSVANSEGYSALNVIDEEMLKEDEICPDDVMKIRLNKDSVDKETLGHLEVWTDRADELGNSRITLGIALAVYAFDASLQEVTDATQLYVNLLTGEDTGEKPAEYTLEKNEKTVRLEGIYHGYVPVTPSPVPVTPEPSKAAGVRGEAAGEKATAASEKAAGEKTTAASEKAAEEKTTAASEKPAGEKTALETSVSEKTTDDPAAEATDKGDSKS